MVSLSSIPVSPCTKKSLAETEKLFLPLTLKFIVFMFDESLFSTSIVKGCMGLVPATSYTRDWLLSFTTTLMAVISLLLFRLMF